jgi:V8-like Glu-specific endopeptidase
MASIQPDQVVVNPQSLARSDEEVLAYWTPQRMESAVPLPLPKVYLPQHLRQQLRALNEKDAAREDALVVSEPEPADAPTAVPLAGGFDTRLVANIGVYPYIITGKLFMTFGTSNYVGSAWTIGERSVFTAGHCVHEHNRGWATNVVFESGYNNGAHTGSWALGTLASLDGWVSGEDFQYDMGMGVAASPIRPTTGKAGWIANLNPIQGKIKSIGYPAEPIAGYNFNGQQMWECDGDYREVSGNIMSMNNNMTGGCSGGPGMYLYSGQYYSIWVNSFRYTTEPNILRSPYFGTPFLNLIQWMKDNGGDA